MPIAKMRASNCPTKTPAQQADHKFGDDSLASLKFPARDKTPAHSTSPQAQRGTTARRMGNVTGLVRELLNLTPQEVSILTQTASNLTARQHRTVLGGTVQIETENADVASRLLSALGFNKMPDIWRLTEPRFSKRVELETRMDTEAHATIESTPAGATIKITIDRNWKLI